jgi:FHS family L-fucose permease-like MFS transporter
LTLNGLGKHTETGGGILCTFSVGAAIIPLLQATTADKLNIHYSFIIPLACYLYVFYFALFGYKAKTNYLFSKSKFIQKSNI